MIIRTFSLTLVALLLVGVGNLSQAQQLKLEVNRQTGEFTLTGVDGMDVDFAGYAIGSSLGTIATANFNGLRDTEADWVLSDNQTASGVQEINSNRDPAVGAVVNNTTSFSLGNAYDPVPALMNLDLGVSAEPDDLTLTYYNQVTNQTLPGVVEFIGEEIFNNVGITVDLATGNAYLENESVSDLTVTGYLIKSATEGILNTAGTFTGLGPGFEPPTTLTGNSVGEIDSTGTGQLLTSSRNANTLGIDLGVVVDPASLDVAEDDLTFTFLLEGAVEVSRTGFIKYLNAPNDGDFNGDGSVNAADYVIYRDEGRDISEYNAWAAAFDGPAPAVATVSGATVPEPNAALILLAGCLAAAAAGRRS